MDQLVVQYEDRDPLKSCHPMNERTSTYFVWTGLLIVVTVCVVFFRDIMMLVLLGTVYAPGFTKEKYEMVKVGDNYESVLVNVGPPLRYIIHSGASGIVNEWFDFTTRSALDTVVTNEHKVVVLVYSKPKRDKSFKAFDIYIRDGKVVEKRSYTYWD